MRKAHALREMLHQRKTFCVFGTQFNGKRPKTVLLRRTALLIYVRFVPDAQLTLCLPLPMSSPLHHLVYQSSATTPMPEHELEWLLRQSRAWNTAHDLTGVLLYSHGNIMQVLEGPTEEVHAIFARIARDYRHANITKLADGPIEQRSFGQWSMGFKSVAPSQFSSLQGYLNPATADYLAGSAHSLDAALLSVLTTFVKEEVMHL